MKRKEWMLYGAYGYTGRLLATEALNRGHRPLLAGRSAEKLIPLAKELNLEYRITDLNNENKLYETVSEFELVFHSAGPFIHTSAPMVEACLKAGTNYLDITGEVPVFEQNFSYHKEAIQSNIALISGVGFDVIPTDCLAKYVSEQISSPTNLEIGIAGESTPSAGTFKTILEHRSTGSLVRRNGELRKSNQENGIHQIIFSDKVRKVFPVTWGDLATAYRTTGIPNITTYMPYSKAISNLLKSTKLDKKKINDWIDTKVQGPDAQTRQDARSYIWARVSNDDGDATQAWIETMEGYRFTAIAGVRSVEKIFELNPKGALTPALAFGKDFILEIPETKRFDTLDILVH